MRTGWLAVAALSALWSGTALAGTLSWRVSEISGPVEVTRGEGAHRAHKGQNLAAGDVVTTGATGRAVLVRGKEFVVVSPDTRLRLPGDPSRSMIQVIQDYGRALFNIEKKSTPHFGVKTPYLAAVVKGTSFTVTTGPAGASVNVSEGVVEVATNIGDVRQLTPAGRTAAVLAANPGEIIAGEVPGAGNYPAHARGDERSGRDKDAAKVRRNIDRASTAAKARTSSSSSSGLDRQTIASQAAAARSEAAAARQNVRAVRDNARTASQQAREAREALKAGRPKKNP